MKILNEMFRCILRLVWVDSRHLDTPYETKTSRMVVVTVGYLTVVV